MPEDARASHHRQPTASWPQHHLHRDTGSRVPPIIEHRRFEKPDRSFGLSWQFRFLRPLRLRLDFRVFRIIREEAVPRVTPRRLSVPRIVPERAHLGISRFSMASMCREGEIGPFNERRSLNRSCNRAPPPMSGDQDSSCIRPRDVMPNRG